MDALGDFFGYDPATPEEREQAIEQSLREAEFDFVLKDGKVYLEASMMAQVFTNLSRMLTLRGVLLNDVQSLGAARGIMTAGVILKDGEREILRRETEAILNADD